MAEIVARRLVDHLERSGFVVIKQAADHRCGCYRLRARGLT
jgi:hypothetical protein